MHPTKAPGPDGFQPVFFQKLWSEVGIDLTRECLHILNDGGNIADWNNTYISLIRKVPSPDSMQNFRPISLCNTSYKVVVKAIVNRLRTWLPHIIDDSQSAFVPRRLISDNILVGFECMNWLRNQKKSKEAYVAAKLDMSKAYDRVEWSFLAVMMRSLGFTQNIMDLIMSCVTTATYSFIVNGKVYGEVKPSRGLRQGDPLSPFLFVICSQGLSSIFHAYVSQQLFSGIRIARRAPVISHLFFADDSLVFFKASSDGACKVMEALNIYSKASGQVINYEKSALTFNPSAKQDVKDEVKSVFGVNVVQGHSLYLGLPTFMMRSRRLQFQFLTEKVSNKLGGWMNKSFSTGGKEVLIKSVIQSIPTYTMACFKVPMSVCSDIERLCARFWWGDKAEEKKMHWATWREVCKPKSKGGMGFRNFSAFNQSMLAKQAWRFIQYPESLVARLFKAKYFPHRDVMETKVGSNSSYVWRSILWGRELLKMGLRWRVGDGERIKAFSDAWLPTFSKGKFFIPREGWDEIRVAEWIDDTNSWDRGKMMNMLQPFEIEEVMRVELKRGRAEDSRYWMHDQKGMYTVKSGYLLATGYYDPPNSSSVDINGKWWKFLWSFDLPPRVRIFVWRAFRGFVPTEMNLHAHHVPVFGRCGWCRKGWGTTSHVLLYCDKVRNCWTSCTFWKILKLREGCDLNAIGEAMRLECSPEEIRLWLLGLWWVWKGLCAERHKAKAFSVSSLQSLCIDYIEKFDEARLQAALQAQILPLEGSVKWRSPKKGRFRLDVDYAVNENDGKGGVGAILRDDTAAIVFAMARPVPISTTILYGELRAIVLGIRQCLEDAISPIEVYTDSILAVHVIAENKEVDSVLSEELFDFFAAVKELNVISVSHVRREANKTADELAFIAKNLATPVLWRDSWPSWLLDIVSSDSS